MRKIFNPLIASLFAGSSLPAWSQTVPSDLAEISMEELFSANVVSTEEALQRSKRWHLSYRYGFSDFEQHYVGTQKRSYQQVLWTPGEARTTENYPVVPTEIRQEVQALLVGYDYSSDLTLRLSVPYIKQSSDHISIVPGYDEFNISSSGLGDIVTFADYTFLKTVNSRWRAGVGLSVPTGSIDEQGDTPRAPGNQQLPYTMQVGSGTWDLPLGLAYEKYGEMFRWGADLRATIRTGENDRDYRLGNKFSAGGWLSFSQFGRLKPSVRLDYRWQDQIQGHDQTLSVPNPNFPYPAPVADPTAFGGEQIEFTLAAEFNIDGSWFVRGEYSEPLWLDLNGPQTAEKYHFALTLGTAF